MHYAKLSVLARSCQLQLPYFCSKVLLSVSQKTKLKKTKTKKKASFCALMDHCEFFGVSAFGISAKSLYSY